MTCLNCGAALESTATVCPVCSTPVGTGHPSPPSRSGSETSGDDRPHGDDSGGHASGDPGQTAGGGDPGQRSWGGDPGQQAWGGQGQQQWGGGQQAWGGDPGQHQAWGGQPNWGAGQQQWSGQSWQQTTYPHPSGLPSDIRNWGVVGHLSAFLAFIGLPVLGPLLIWLVKREHPFVEHHAKEALNFNISVAIYGIALAIIGFPLGIITFGIGLVPVVLAGLILAVVWFVLPIVAAIRASNGEGYRYPMTMRFVR